MDHDLSYPIEGVEYALVIAGIDQENVDGILVGRINRLAGGYGDLVPRGIG